MDWTKFWEHLPYWFITIVLLIVLTVGYSAPKVSNAVKTVEGISSPAIQYEDYPILHGGCSRLDIDFNWRGKQVK